MMNKKITDYRKVFVSCLILLTLTGCFQKRLHSQKKLLLGTVVEVISPYPEAAKIAFREIERIDKIFSPNNKDSAVAHLNKTGFLSNNFEVSLLIKKARMFYALTNGLFDISVAPLSNIWKAALKKDSLPDESLIAQKKSLVNLDNIYIDEENHIIKFKKSGMEIDLGGLAKGYAVDAAIKELKRNGIDSAIVNAGGDIFCLGAKFGRPWRLGLQHPRRKELIVDSLEVKDSAVATSGDYEQFMEIDQKRYSHVINPETGYPVENDIVSVTVVAKDTVTADAVATSIFLLGKEKGKKIFQNYEGVKKIIIITKDEVSGN